ncbi:hypothetical protein J2T37_001611 [Neisseria perflava]|nr:hypothetical protein [Neisseria perflava]MCP1771897.1 hypothetical protein [Neisseria perflava]
MQMGIKTSIRLENVKKDSAYAKGRLKPYISDGLWCGLNN